MKNQGEVGMTLKIICSCLLILASGTTVSSQTQCPFDYLFHFGDGFTDIGNSILVLPNVTIPPGLPPYGRTYPGYPTGRWSDGLVDFDFTAESFGLPNIVPYLAMNKSMARSYDGVIFSVGRSPVLGNYFYRQRGITIPHYAVSLRRQFLWFLKLLRSVCKHSSDVQKCKRQWLANSLVLMGDIEGNDVGYALTQGKSIDEVMTYVPYIVNTTINITRDIIKLGATRVIIPGNVPLGCYPYILTALQTNDSTAYDELGCLKSVNDFIIWKNDRLTQAIADLRKEFPNVLILDGPMYDGIRSIIANASVITPEGNTALKSCCGIGGRYNYDPERFCSDEGVPVCINPNDYIFWDGEHCTQQTQFVAEDMLVQPALVNLNCTSTTSALMRLKQGKISSVLSSVLSTYASSY